MRIVCMALLAIASNAAVFPFFNSLAELRSAGYVRMSPSLHSQRSRARNCRGPRIGRNECLRLRGGSDDVGEVRLDRETEGEGGLFGRDDVEDGSGRRGLGVPR